MMQPSRYILSLSPDKISSGHKWQQMVASLSEFRVYNISMQRSEYSGSLHYQYTRKIVYEHDSEQQRHLTGIKSAEQNSRNWVLEDSEQTHPAEHREGEGGRTQAHGLPRQERQVL